MPIKIETLKTISGLPALHNFPEF